MPAVCGLCLSDVGCTHCNAMKPAFVEAATRLKAENASIVAFELMREKFETFVFRRHTEYWFHAMNTGRPFSIGMLQLYIGSILVLESGWLAIIAPVRYTHARLF